MQRTSILNPDDIRRLVTKWSVDCGARVLERRELLEMDRPTLAALASTTEATIHRVEHGRINPRDHLKASIAVALAVEIEELWPSMSREQIIEGAREVA